MEGVTIINTIHDYGSEPGIWLFAIFGTICLVIVIISWIYQGYFDPSNVLFLILGGVLFIGLILLVFFGEPVHEEYQVLIDESVSITEFLQHYKIIRQEGISYIVELIENGL